MEQTPGLTFLMLKETITGIRINQMPCVGEDRKMPQAAVVAGWDDGLQPRLGEQPG